MVRSTRTIRDEVEQEVAIDGHRLKMVTRRLEGGEWEVYVENAQGVRSIWFECFDSPQAALAAASAAIAREGAAAFVDIEDFGLLPEDVSDPPGR
jgi:hypothetical protein